MGVTKKQKNEIQYAGRHLIAEFWGGKEISSTKEIRKILMAATKKSGATLLSLQVHKFAPHGISGVAMLSESHISLHSWPELNYVAIDIFTCGTKVKPEKAISVLKKYYKPKKFVIKELKRGNIKAKR